MTQPKREKLTIAIASRALFDLEESHRIFVEQGVEAYSRYQIDNEDVPLAPGVAFPLVRKFLAINSALGDVGIEVILLSHNSADTGLRIFNSIRHHGLDITRAAFAGGQSPYRYVAPFGAHLFLSANPDDVAEALQRGYAAATIVSGTRGSSDEGQLRIAFDGDAVLFSDESERIFQEQGLAAFEQHEQTAANQPLPGGPFKEFLRLLHRIQSEFPVEQQPIRTALVTARGAPAHERVIRTLRAWDIRIDEAMFLGGMPKGQFLKAFNADLFFDDQQQHCISAAEHVPTGHVPHGVKNAGGGH
jgi:5'-nucleotidase